MRISCSPQARVTQINASSEWLRGACPSVGLRPAPACRYMRAGGSRHTPSFLGVTSRSRASANTCLSRSRTSRLRPRQPAWSRWWRVLFPSDRPCWAFGRNFDIHCASVAPPVSGVDEMTKDSGLCRCVMLRRPVFDRAALASNGGAAIRDAAQPPGRGGTAPLPVAFRPAMEPLWADCSGCWCAARPHNCPSYLRRRKRAWCRPERLVSSNSRRG
jgi:hypothetical protein